MDWCRPNPLKIAAALPITPGRTEGPRPVSPMATPPPLQLDPATLLFSIGVLGWLLAAEIMAVTKRPLKKSIELLQKEVGTFLHIYEPTRQFP